jgi:hypothetical protein
LCGRRYKCIGKSYLDETNIGGLLTEALTADVEAVLADETSRVGADAAVSTSLATVPSYNALHSPASATLLLATLAPLFDCNSKWMKVLTYHSREPLP